MRLKIAFVTTMFVTLLLPACNSAIQDTLPPETTISSAIPISSTPAAATVVPSSIPTTLPLSVSAKSCASARGPLPQIPTPEASNQGVDLRGDLNKSLGGGVVQGKDFTIELFLFCDRFFGPFSMEPYFYSDIDHLAVFINWRFDGPIENAPSYIFQGIEPDLHGYAIDHRMRELNGGQGISRGLYKPFPDFSSKVTLRFLYIALFPSGEFSGAILSFDLQQVSDGLQPSNVFISPLSNRDKIFSAAIQP